MLDNSSENVFVYPDGLNQFFVLLRFRPKSSTNSKLAFMGQPEQGETGRHRTINPLVSASSEIHWEFGHILPRLLIPPRYPPRYRLRCKAFTCVNLP